MTPAAAAALSLLRESRDGARTFDDNGRTITRLAQTAGVRVVYISVDLTAQTVEYRTVEGGGI